MEDQVYADFITSDEESSAALVRRSSKTKSDVNFRENGSNKTVKRESEIKSDSFAVSDEKPLADNNKEENEANRAMMFNGDSASSSMEPSNASEVMAMAFDSLHSEAALETSVYFAEKEGSENTEPLERGGASFDHESEKTESFVILKSIHSEKREKGKNVCIDTHVFSDTGSTVIVRNGDLTVNKEEEKAGNGGFKQHQHGSSGSEFAGQNSHSSSLNEQDERQLKEYWTRILEKSEFEGKVESIVKILKEQQSHDLFCPVCSQCITERVILRKRKRTSIGSYDGWHKEATDDVEAIVSEGEHDMAVNQNDQAEISNEDSEDIEAYGCLACFSLIFRREPAKSQSGSRSLSGQYTSEVHQESEEFTDREKESFYCLPFLSWRQRNNKESSSVAVQEFTSTITSQRISSPAVTSQNVTLQTSSTTDKSEMDTTPMETIIAQEKHTSTVSNEAPVKQWEKKPSDQEGVKGTEDQRTELHFYGEEKKLQTAQISRCESVKPQEMPAREIDASMIEDGIRPHLGPQYQLLNKSSTAPADGELPTPEKKLESLKEKGTLRQRESYKRDNLCSCIPVSIPAGWSIWSNSTKKSPTDELKDRLLPNVEDENFDKVLPGASKDDFEEVISPQKSGSAGSSSLVTGDPASLAQSRVDDSFSAADTAIVVEGTSPQLSQVSSVATEWDLLKSIVYGGLTVSITSLGVVSASAGGDAKTLTVIAIALANLVSGLFLLFNNILDLHLDHQDQFIGTVGHSFWFNGFVAVFSYLVFGSLAPVTYGFSFQKSDDKLYKFLGASIVSLVSIILLSLGKARVTKKPYIRVMILYIVAGFWASFIGFFAGEYIKKLLEKWGIVTD